MAKAVNGPGFGSVEEIKRFYAERMAPEHTALNYLEAPRTAQDLIREPLPASPLDGAAFYGTQTTPSQQVGTAPPQPVPQPVPQPPKKSLKDIAWERGHIPRREK